MDLTKKQYEKMMSNEPAKKQKHYSLATIMGNSPKSKALKTSSYNRLGRFEKLLDDTNITKKMIIKKISEKIIYYNVTRLKVFEINGKLVEVESRRLDTLDGETEADAIINNEDMKTLTDTEAEAIGENLTELIELKDGETYEA